MSDQDDTDVDDIDDTKNTENTENTAEGGKSLGGGHTERNCDDDVARAVRGTGMVKNNRQ